MRNLRKLATWVAVATSTAALGVGAPAVGTADPAGHQVTYTVTSPNTLTATVAYMNSDPPSQAAYNADSSKYMNNVQAPVTG